MRSLLVPVELCEGTAAQLATALLAAKRFGAHVDGLAPRLAASAFALADGMGGGSVAVLEQFDQEESDRAERARQAFRDFMAEHEVLWGDPLKPSRQASADWLSDVEPGDEAVGQRARLYDATLLPRPVEGQGRPRASLLETTLFESGRPVLVTPPVAPERLGASVLVAWNGSTESARSLRLAEPFLAAAERVVVLAVEGGSVPGPSAGEVVAALRRAGIKAEAAAVRPEGQTIGAAILSEAGRLNADLLVKGAYTQSRLRQMILGGATSHILKEAELPVLMAH